MTAEPETPPEQAHPEGEQTDPRIVWGGAAAIEDMLAGVLFFSHGEDRKEAK